MVKKLILSISCALLSLSSWADNNDKNVRVTKLTGQEIKVDPSNPRRYPRFIFGDILISASNEFYGDNIKDNKWVEGEVIPKIGSSDGIIHQHLAKGPDKSFIRIESLSMGGAMKKMIIVPNTSSVSAFKDESTWRTFDLQGLPSLSYANNGVAILSDSTMLIPAFTGQNTKNIFAIVDFKNKKFTPLDYWPDDGIDSVSDYAKSSYYTENCELETNGKGRFFYRAGYSNNAFVFAIDNDKVNIVKHLHVDHPKYFSPDGYNFIPRLRNEKIKSATNNQNIALILQDADKSGAKISKRKISRPSYFGNIVELYDWDGNKKHTLYLDHYGQRIFLSDDSKKLYLTWCNDRTGEDSQIWVYDLTNLDKQPQAELAELEKKRKVIEEEEEPQPEADATGMVPLKEGEMMADFELYDYDDKPHHLNEFLGKGKYTILEFSDIYCGPCQLAKPTLEKFYEKHKDRFEMITISGDKEKAWKQKPQGEVSWHEWNDHKEAREIGKKYGITGIPSFVIISPEGKIERKCSALGGFFKALNDYISAEEVDELKKVFVETVKKLAGK